MKRRKIKWIIGVTEFIILFIFWLLLTGDFQLKFLIPGIIASVLVTYLTNELIYNIESGINHKIIPYLLRYSLGMMLYLPWLLLAIIKANIQVAAIIINPRMPIDPAFLQFKSKMTKKVALVTLANSITLTPGTVTVELIDGKYTVHSLVHDCARDLEAGTMQNKVARIFKDNKETNPPECNWIHSLQEMEK
jgi:multicomponent Na+:H+ antiporter subunit E